jgi:hypothetical protein
MTAIIMSGPIRPLTEVERFFAGIKIGRIELNGEVWIRRNNANRMLGRVEANQLTQLAEASGWRTIQPHSIRKGPKDKWPIYYALSDVMQTVKQLKKGKRKRK